MRIGGEFMNCLVQIKEAQKSYTSTEKIIAQYILEHTHEILNDSEGRPYVNILNSKIDNIINIDISLSHCKEYAIANVTVLEEI